MLLRMFALSSAIALTNVTSALPFEIMSYSAGEGLPGLRGEGFFTDGPMGFFQSGEPGHSDFGSVDLSSSLSLSAELDSHFTFDDFGPTALVSSVTANVYGGYPAPGYNGIDGVLAGDSGTGQAGRFRNRFDIGPGSNIGATDPGIAKLALSFNGFNVSPFRSGLLPDFTGGRTSQDAVFISRLTVESGSAIRGSALFRLRDENLGSPVAVLLEGTVSLGGSAVQIGRNQSYALRAFLVTQTTNLSEGGFSGRTFAAADTYDVWLIAIPSPGVGGFAGICVLCTLRRHRPARTGATTTNPRPSARRTRQLGATVSPSAAILLTASAGAAPFQFIGYSAGGGLAGVQGEGFRTDGALGFFQSQEPGNSDVGSITITPTLSRSAELDSHFTIDDFGPSAIVPSVTTNVYGDYPAPGYNGTDGALVGDPGTGQAGRFQPVNAIGSNIGAASPGLAQVGFALGPQPFRSGLLPDFAGGRTTLDGVFIARLTVEGGASLTGGAVVALKNEEGLTNPGAPSFLGEVSLDGGAVRIGNQEYVLRSFLITSTTNLSEGGFSGRVFASADTYDLWLIAIPSPGSASVVLLCGLPYLCRRRGCARPSHSLLRVVSRS